eukprot:SAG11_NODE_738_length_7426_cov_14.966289_2_plen_66_part_00
MMADVSFSSRITCVAAGGTSDSLPTTRDGCATVTRGRQFRGNILSFQGQCPISQGKSGVVSDGRA